MLIRTRFASSRAIQKYTFTRSIGIGLIFPGIASHEVVSDSLRQA